MKILITTLFIDLVVLANAIDSPERLPDHKHAALDEAGYSGRPVDEDLFSEIVTHGAIKYTADAFSSISHHNDNGIFYEENNRLYAVRTGMPLLEDRGVIVGRPKNGYVVLVYDSDGYPVQVSAMNYKMQHFMSVSSVRKSYIRIPESYKEVSAELRREPKILYSDASIKPGKLNVRELDKKYFPKESNAKI